MNSRETLTCNLFHLPQDIFRVIFQYLSAKDLMKGEEAFLNNQELLSLYRSSLAGFTLEEIITIDKDEDRNEELIYWIIDHKLLFETLELCNLRYFDMNLLNQSRSSLKTIHFSYIYPNSNNSIPAISQLGHFPSLTSVTFFSSHYFTTDHLLSFFSHNPQLEKVEIEHMHQLSNESIPHLSNSCPKIKILSLYDNNWVNDGTISLLTQQGLFPNLKSLNIQYTKVTNQESLRQFILSHPLLCGTLLPDDIQYSTDFLIFYLRQLIFPSILNHNNNSNLESYSMAISSLWSCFVDGRILYKRNGVVNPEIFSVDILSHLYHKGCSLETLHNSTEVFFHLSKFPTMIDSITQSQFIPFIFNDTRPDDYILSDYFVDLLFRCDVFHDHFPLLLEKYQPHPSSLMKIIHRAIRHNFPLLTTEELQTMISIVLNKLPDKDSTFECLKTISKLLQEPSSQHLVDPNTLLLLFKSIDFVAGYNIGGLINCLKRFISVNENYQQLLLESNLLPQIMRVVDPLNFVDFTKHCLTFSGDGLLVDHLVDSGLVQELLSNYFELCIKNEIESVFTELIHFKNKKYSEIVREMNLPDELRVKLFEKGERS